jgi:hypothetical protein
MEIVMRLEAASNRRLKHFDLSEEQLAPKLRPLASSPLVSLASARRAENAGIVRNLLDVAEHWNLQHVPVFTVAVGVLSNMVSNVPAWLVMAMTSSRKFYDHRSVRHYTAGAIGIEKVMSGATLARLLLPESYPHSGSGRADLRDAVGL